jgi:hypothetical protein
MLSYKLYSWTRFQHIVNISCIMHSWAHTHGHTHAHTHTRHVLVMVRLWTYVVLRCMDLFTRMCVSTSAQVITWLGVFHGRVITCVSMCVFSKSCLPMRTRHLFCVMRVIVWLCCVGVSSCVLSQTCLAHGAYVCNVASTLERFANQTQTYFVRTSIKCLACLDVLYLVTSTYKT